MKLSDYKPLNNMMFLFKSESGCGKSTAIGSFPEPIYVASCDGRIAPLKHNPLLRVRDIEFDIFTEYRPLIEKLEQIEKSNNYATVAVDPLTGFARLAIDHLFNNRGLDTRKGSDKEPRSVGGIPLMSIQEYAGETSAIGNMLILLRIIRNHGANVVLTSHVVTSEQKSLDGKYITTRRLLTGGNKIAAEIPSYFDEVYHFYSASGLSNEKKYFATTYNTGEDYSRTSFFGLQKEIDFTNALFYDRLLEAIKNSETGEQSEEIKSKETTWPTQLT